MVVVKASVTRTSAAVEYGCALRAARDRLALHSLKIASASVQATGWESLTLG